MASPVPYHCTRCFNNTNGTSFRYRQFAPMPDHICACTLQPQGYGLSQIENESHLSVFSSDLQPDYSGLDLGHGQNSNGLLTIDGGLNYSMPLGGNSPLLGEFVGDFEPSCFVGSNAIAYTPKLHSYLMPSQAMRRQPIGFGLKYTGASGMLNENFIVHGNEYTADCMPIYSDDMQHTFDFDYGASDLQGDDGIFPMSIIMGSQPLSSETPWLPESAHPRDSDLSFNNEGLPDLVFQGNVVDIPPRTHQAHQPPGGTPLELYNLFLSEGPSAIFNLESDTSTLPTPIREIPKYTNIAPKPAAFPEKAVKGIKKNNKERRRPGAEERRKISNVRRVGACSYCRKNRISCSESGVCPNCIKRYIPGLSPQLYCQRGPMPSYTKLFFLPMFSDSSDQSSNEAYIKDNNIVFTENYYEVQVSSDPFSISMSVVVHEIFSASQSCLLSPVLTPHEFESRATIWVGIRNLDVVLFEESILGYIKKVREYPLDDIEAISGDTSPITWKILKAIRRYKETTRDEEEIKLLDKALNVFWINYLLGRSISLIDDTTIEDLQYSSTLPTSQSTISTSVLSFQIHWVMNRLFKEYMDDLFDGMNRVLKNHNARCGIALCVNFILNILAGQLIVDVDALAMHEIINEGKDPTDVRRRGTQACRDLQNQPLRYAWDSFRGIPKAPDYVGRGVPKRNLYRLNQMEATLVFELRQVLNKHGDEIAVLSAEECIPGFSTTVEEHYALRKRYSASQESRFLKAFC